jgi:hypothetical protein
MKWHILAHAVAGVGAILLFVAPFVGRTRNAPLSIRLPLILLGPVGIAWSIIGIYLYSHDRDASHTLLPWSQYWALSHLKSTLGGVALGILATLLMNADFYKRKRVATVST